MNMETDMEMGMEIELAMEMDMKMDNAKCKLQDTGCILQTATCETQCCVSIPSGHEHGHGNGHGKLHRNRH